MSILLYESYTPHKKRAFAKTKDTERNLVIMLAAGKGTLVDAWGFDPATGAKLTKAYPAQEIGIAVKVKNDGDKDWIWITVKDKDTGVIIKTKGGYAFNKETELAAGAEWTIEIGTLPSLVFVMPNKTWNLLVEAGHGR